MKKSKYSDLATNTVLFTISSFGSKLLNFFLVPLYTRVLSTAAYGTADLITTTSTLLVYLFTLNIADAVLRFTIERKNNDYFSFAIKVLTVGSVIFGAITIAMYYFNILGMEAYCYAFLFLSFFVNALYQIASNYLRAVGKVREVATAGIITTLITIVSNIMFLLVIRLDILGYLISYTLGIAVATIYCFSFIKVRIFDITSAKCSRAEQQAIWAYCIPLVFNGVSWWMNTSLNRYFIVSVLGLAANGIFAVANKIPTILSVFQNIFSQAWNLSALQEFDANDEDGFFANTYKMYSSFMVIVCSGLILVNILMSQFLFAKDYENAWRYSSILLISVLFSALSGFMGSIFSAVKETKVVAGTTIAGAVFNALLNAVLVPKFQLYGAAIATTVSFFIVWLLRLILSQKFIKWKVVGFQECLSYSLLIAEVVIEQSMPGLVGFGGKLCVVLVILFVNRTILIDFVKTLLKKIGSARGASE